MLEDHADAPAQGQQPGAVEPDHLDAIHQDAAGLRPLQPVDAADEGALAGAAAADAAQHLARANFERDVVEGGDSGATGSGQAIADPVDTDDRPRRAAPLLRRNPPGRLRWRWGGTPDRFREQSKAPVCDSTS